MMFEMWMKIDEKDPGKWDLAYIDVDSIGFCGEAADRPGHSVIRCGGIAYLVKNNPAELQQLLMKRKQDKEKMFMEQRHFLSVGTDAMTDDSD